jgi:hypothetical protein
VSAPTHEAPTEQPTQPLPIGATLPPGHGAFKESGLWLFPGGPVAAVVVGIPLHELWINTDDAMFVFAVVLLVGVLGLVYLAFMIPRTISRGRDGRA